jgi:hypothetical protein
MDVLAALELWLYQKAKYLLRKGCFVRVQHHPDALVRDMSSGTSFDVCRRGSKAPIPEAMYAN